VGFYKDFRYFVRNITIYNLQKLKLLKYSADMCSAEAAGEVPKYQRILAKERK